MPDPISPFSQFQKSAAQFQRPQGAMSSGDAQDALKSLQDMVNNGSASNNGTPNASNTTNSGLDGLLKNPGIQGLLNDPKIQNALGSLQKGQGARERRFRELLPPKTPMQRATEHSPRIPL